MIYIPDDSYSCYVVQNEDVIRAYESMPRNDTTVNYRDYYINSDYIYKDSEQTFSRYQDLPVCLSTSTLTTEPYYRTDFPDILVMLFIFCFFTLWIPWKIFCRLFRRLN